MVKLIASRFSELPRSQSSIRQVTQFKPKVPLEPETTTIYNSYPLLFSPSPCVSSFCSFEASSISYSFFLTSSTSSDDPPSSKLSPLCLYSLIQEQPFLVFVTVSSTPFFFLFSGYPFFHDYFPLYEHENAHNSIEDQ